MIGRAIRSRCSWSAPVGELFRSVRHIARHSLKQLGPHDALFRWHRPRARSKLLSPQEWAQVPETLVVRVVQIQIVQPGFRTRELTVVTTLLDPERYPAQEILCAFLKRWRLEMCLDDLRTTLRLEKLNCLTPKLVQKELLVFLIAHNLLRWIMGQAAQAGAVDLERISFKGTLDAFRQWSEALEQVRGPGKLAKQKRLWRKLLQTLAADLVPERPGRQEPRAVKKKSKYPRLTKPRNRYVERWSATSATGVVSPPWGFGQFCLGFTQGDAPRGLEVCPGLACPGPLALRRTRVGDC